MALSLQKLGSPLMPRDTCLGLSASLRDYPQVSNPLAERAAAGAMRTRTASPGAASRGAAARGAAWRRGRLKRRVTWGHRHASCITLMPDLAQIMVSAVNTSQVRAVSHSSLLQGSFAAANTCSSRRRPEEEGPHEVVRSDRKPTVDLCANLLALLTGEN